MDTVLVKNINPIIKDKPLIGVTSLDITKNKYIPVIFGEQDVLKSIQLLPGIKSAGDGNSGFYVRGGNTDQNLILYDEAPIYNASHLLGFFLLSTQTLYNLSMFTKATCPRITVDDFPL